MTFKLSNVLAAHESDVRDVKSPSPNLVLSASRDTTAIAWTRVNHSQPFTRSLVFRVGSRYVNSIAYLPPSQAHPQGLVITGGQDAIVNAFDLGSNDVEPIYALLGHKENVCTLDTFGENTVISGSWDKTARVWREFKPALELTGHEQAVWAVAAINGISFLTASADRTIKLWEEHKNVRTYRGHNDAVRGLALISEIGFASCSNDGEIRVWTLDGDNLHILSGHTSFVYSLAVLPSGDIISGGEDRSVRVWKDGTCIQTIVHPAISVWAVSAMPNGDIVSGCSDGVVRVFSAAKDRWASQEDLKKYDEQIANQALSSGQVGDVKKSDLPGLEALQQPGKREGQVKMIKNSGVVEAHQWSTSAFQWQKVGEVLDAVGSGRRQLCEGKEYDYVFDVDIQDGVPPLKLPYNANENPYKAAQRFLTKHDISMSYIDQVVDFIEKNVKPVTIGQSEEEFIDPFTGTSRYRSGDASRPGASQGGTGGHVDPFTGDSRYKPSSGILQSSTAQNVHQDPFTGNSRFQPLVPGTSPSSPIIPSSHPLSFKQANVNAMKSKFYALNNDLTDPTLSLSSEELRLLDDVFTGLTAAVSTRSSTIDLQPTHISVITRVAARWPTPQCFPVIDLARLVCAYSPSACSEGSILTELFQSLVRAAEMNSPWIVPLDKHRDINTLLLLRTTANAIQGRFSASIDEWATLVLTPFQDVSYSSLNKNQRIALATCLFNLSIVSLKGGLQSELSKLTHTLLAKALREEGEDSEAYYRTLVAVGNFVYSFSVTGIELDEQLRTAIHTASADTSSRFKEKRIADAVSELENIARRE